jgi:hypothetical protein
MYVYRRKIINFYSKNALCYYAVALYSFTTLELYYFFLLLRKNPLDYYFACIVVVNLKVVGLASDTFLTQ